MTVQDFPVDVLSVNVRLVLDRAPFLTFDQLSDTAKTKARRALRLNWEQSRSREIAKCKARGIHARVNDLYHISRILNTIETIKKLRDDAQLDKNILGNLCPFLSDGTYITYMS